MGLLSSNPTLSAIPLGSGPETWVRHFVLQIEVAQITIHKADRGSLLLDEVGDKPLELQLKLLRVLQEREFEPVGSTRNTHVDIRIIAATNQDLQQMFLRPGVPQSHVLPPQLFPIDLPRLRERQADIPELVEYLAQQYSVSRGKTIEKPVADACGSAS